MMEQILQFIIAPLATIVVTWLVSRRVSKAEAVAKEIENEKNKLENDVKEIDIYKRIISDLKVELDDRVEHQKTLLKMMEQISTQNEELLIKVDQLERDYESLKRNNAELLKQYKRLLINKTSKDGKN